MKTGRENIRRRTDGRWEARIVNGCPKDGKTTYKYLYGKTYEEVLDKKQRFLLGEEETGAIYRQAMPARKAVRRAVSAQENAAVAAGECTGQSGRTSQACSLIADSRQKAVQTTQNTGRENNSVPKADIVSAKGGFVDETALFRYAAAEWLHYKEPLVRESTFVYYSAMVRNQLLPVLGGVALLELTQERILDFLNDKKAHGRKEDGSPLAVKTVADLKVILKQILKYAGEKGLLEVIPTCPAVTVRQGKIRVLTRQEQRRLEQAALALDCPFTLGILMSLYGGLRIGEVCALQWGDFDFRNGTVRVNKTVTRIQNLENGKKVGTKLIIGSPKTECSLRTVPLPETVMQYFKERHREDEIFMMTGTDRPMEPRGCLSRFQRF